MSLSADLDMWATGIAGATGLRTVCDPDLIVPPCIFVSGPDTVASTLPAFTMNVPVYLVASGAGKQARDWLLDHLADFLSALEEKEAQFTALSVGGVDYHAYQATARLIVS